MAVVNRNVLTALNIENTMAWLGLAWLGLAHALEVYPFIKLNITL